tara:strand:- start:217 stop:492 length:276 start_codon:yes stop_codon:yes gene_type:complete
LVKGCIFTYQKQGNILKHNKKNLSIMNAKMKNKKEQIEKTIERLNKQLTELNELNKIQIDKTFSGEDFCNERTISILRSSTNKLTQINLLK